MIIYITSLILGLTSNFHCLGMCGPLVMAIPVNRSNNITILSGVTQYNMGRILVYSALGAIIGIIGITIETFGILQWISILSGVFMIMYAWRKWFSTRLEGKMPLFNLNSFVSKKLGKVLHSQSPFKLILLGMLNGLLPCGMVYLALMNAVLGGNSITSAGAMALFGLGTLPAMIFVGFAANRITGKMRQKISNLVPYLLTIVGILIILRGLNLDIPYISPKVKMLSHTEKNIETKQTVEMSCCHNKKSCEK
jgi:sulfite exporter TauE/SafE